jgi:hypothetical protein
MLGNASMLDLDHSYEGRMPHFVALGHARL